MDFTKAVTKGKLLADQYSHVIDEVVKQYDERMGQDIVHGTRHWTNVFTNAYHIIENSPEVHNQLEEYLLGAFLFALFHDSKRKDEGLDLLHGYKGGAYFLEMVIKHNIEISPTIQTKIYRAITNHSTEIKSGISIISVCYDADRFDLFRVGKIPKIQYFSTPYCVNNFSNIIWNYKNKSSIETRVTDVFR